MVSFKISLKLLSEANLREHWTAKHKRHQLYKKKLLPIKRDLQNVKLPCTITLVRIAARQLDDDNLRMAFKKIRDILADYMITELAPGRADGDPRLDWHYSQEKGEVKEFAIRIDIEEK
jgi:hypothetical protein